MEEKIKIMIVDDHEVYREGLKTALNNVVNFEVVAEASNGMEFLEMIGKINVDVVLMDIKMPVVSGLEATRIALENNPDLKIISLSMYNEEEYVNQMKELGAKSYVLKGSNKNELVSIIYGVATGKRLFPVDFLKNKRNEYVNEI
ncbi:MAG: response regulator transcription factor [Bacteroidales bacterium]|nr:response regulator transcription factor [Bacteroidales bacterium]MCF8399676.1 response regulator transcription factor [Bacteroidales bacterium]